MTKCVMCSHYEALFIDKKTNEPLCQRCANVNESIYRQKGKRGEYEAIK